MGIGDWIIRVLRMGRGIVSLVLALLFCLVLLSMEKKEKQIFHEVAVSTFLFPAQYVLNQVNKSVLIWKENKVLKQEKGYDLLISIAVPHPIHWGVAMAREKK